MHESNAVEIALLGNSFICSMNAISIFDVDPVTGESVDVRSDSAEVAGIGGAKH